MNAPYSGGAMMTVPVKFQGGQFEINYATSAIGSVWCALLDGGAPLDGYALEDCEEICGDELERSCAVEQRYRCWRSGRQDTALLVSLRDADLYSFRFR
ncbi:MAG: hypothetical protein MK102_14400 [Fuerstiella sp.]|nr:hypothetical protein [Fuerstiella sp.]